MTERDSRAPRWARSLGVIALASLGFALTYVPVFDRTTHCRVPLDGEIHGGSYYPISIAILLFRVLLLQIGAGAVRALCLKASPDASITAVRYVTRQMGRPEPYRQPTVKLPEFARDAEGAVGLVARWAPRVARYLNLVMLALSAFCAVGLFGYEYEDFFVNLPRCGCPISSHPRDACRDALAALHPMTFSSLYVLDAWRLVFRLGRWNLAYLYLLFTTVCIPVVVLLLRPTVRTGPRSFSAAVVTAAVFSVASLCTTAFTLTGWWEQRFGWNRVRYDLWVLTPALANLLSLLLACAYLVALWKERYSIRAHDGGP